MKTKKVIQSLFASYIFITAGNLAAEPIGRITQDVVTDFGVYRPVLVDVLPSVQPYTIEKDFSNVENADDFDLREEAKELLVANGFACTASNFRQIYDSYNEAVDKGIPIFVTADACLHTYHILYDYMLRILEVQYFIDDLENLTQVMIENMQDNYESCTDESMKEAALDAVRYLTVAMSLINPELGTIYKQYENISEDVDREVTQINDLSDGYIPSTLFYSTDYPYREDYSQYNPRGHYTRSDELKRYFRAMMWYGRITFSLNLPYSTREGIRHIARQGLLIARTLATSKIGEEDATVVWNRIYHPTVFFVGKTDDITYSEYVSLAVEVYGEKFLSLDTPHMLADDEMIDTFITRALDELPDPKITVAAGKGFRFMGQRFIPDSYILDQLVDPFVPNRLMPRGLDFIAVFGSERAYEILDTLYQETLFPKYTDQIEKLRKEFLDYPPEQWAENLYYNWLYTLLPLLEAKDDGYPFFMQNQAWVEKDLNTALGSWAELRHDTILYAKQSETRETSEPPEPSFVMGYVEPCPEVYARLAALADFMRRGIADRGLHDSEVDTRLGQFETLMLALKDIAVKELMNITPLPGEFALICNFGKSIESITTFPPDYASQYENEADDFMAVIADIHFDPNFNEVLEVGVGHPLNIYVIAPVNGIPTLTRGSIFSYHEFKWALAGAQERLTDEQWQELQSGNEAKPMQEWTMSFIAGESSAKERTFHYPGDSPPVTGVEIDAAPLPFELRQNSPNPFNPSTVLTYSLNESGMVKIAVYNLAGQLVEVLEEIWRAPGHYTVTWVPDSIASGVYVVHLIQGDRSIAIKVVYMK